MEEKSLAKESRRVFGEPFVRALSDARFVEHPIRDAVSASGSNLSSVAGKSH
jgi:hypothetical protein